MLMWYEIMKEFKCKATSTWSSCDDDEREMDFTHRQFGKAGKSNTPKLDYILGPKMASNQVYIHDDVKLQGTCDHYPFLRP